MRGAMQVAASESGDAEAAGRKSMSRKPMSFRMVEKPGAIIGHIDPLQREMPRYPFLVTAVRQSHLVSLSRVDVMDVLANFEGDDSESVMKVLRAEHQTTITSLADKHAQKPPAKSEESAAAASTDKAVDPSASKRDVQSEDELQTLRARVLAMEQKLAQCVDDMRAARECTEVLPHLVYLVRSCLSIPGTNRPL